MSKDKKPWPTYRYPANVSTAYIDKDELKALEAIAKAARGVVAADQMHSIFEVSGAVAKAINALDEGRKGRT